MAEKKQIQLKYIFPDNYRPVYTNSVYGGITPRGELEIHFLYDRPPLPKGSQIVVKEGFGQREEADYGKWDGLHIVQTGVIMDYDSAKRLHKWLSEKIKAFEGVIGKERAGKEEHGPLQ